MVHGRAEPNPIPLIPGSPIPHSPLPDPKGSHCRAPMLGAPTCPARQAPAPLRSTQHRSLPSSRKYRVPPGAIFNFLQCRDLQRDARKATFLLFDSVLFDKAQGAVPMGKLPQEETLHRENLPRKARLRFCRWSLLISVGFWSVPFLQAPSQSPANCRPLVKPGWCILCTFTCIESAVQVKNARAPLCPSPQREAVPWERDRGKQSYLILIF